MQARSGVAVYSMFESMIARQGKEPTNFRGDVQFPEFVVLLHCALFRQIDLGMMKIANFDCNIFWTNWNTFTFKLETKLRRMFEFSYFPYFWYVLRGTFLLNCSCSLFYYSCSMFFYEYVDLIKCSFSHTFAWMLNVRTFVLERNEYWTLCNYIPNEIIRIGKPLLKQSCASWNYNT